ncbi:D-arabinono-1,4-lactone oxidase [Microbacterium stercoris]|uniref:FAD-binding protein n=1 Tax=Microbacterium stercoris TaxID=2820289 RepID=A0A939QLL4_9MICO|nr:D-arabinono-1,4-lactone oxidase [Microbacterium stercoris]MBO3665164.1 FAD-binding protein [Microbacterium stercoris]
MSAASPAPWRNWARNQYAQPSRMIRPSSTAEVAEIVAEARAAGTTVKPLGAGHSFTGIAATDGAQLRLDGMSTVRWHDPESGRVRVQAGISLHALGPQLRALGLALPNMGDVDPQSVAGAISTGTHGTGARARGIAHAVVGLQLVTGAGEVVEIDEAHPWFDAARVSLGALGVITEVTLQCVPAFALHAVEQPMRLPEVLEGLAGFLGDDHFEFYWFPHTESALVKRNNRVAQGTPLRPVARIRHLWDDEILSNGVFGAVNAVGAAVPAWIPRINRISGSALSPREYVDHSHDVFVSPRRVRFVESEWAVPRDALPDVIAELQRWFAASGERVAFPIEVRFAAADDIWLSTGYARENAYVAVHQWFRRPHERYFAAAQAIFDAHEGRPHWGKLHTLTADRLRERYARFDDFRAIREATDPDRVFDNPYLRQVLG